MKIAVAQLGARMHYAVPEILHGEGMLRRLYTDAYGGSFPFRGLRYVPARLRPAALRRLIGRSARLPVGKVKAFQGFGLRYAHRLGRARTATETTAIHLWAGSRFNELILRDSVDRAGVVYGYQSAALELFRHARSAGRKTVLEQTILPRVLQDELMAEERVRWPEWQSKAPDERADAYAAREAREWDAADLILCGSQFVAEGLQHLGVPEDRVRVVPYGVRLTEQEERNAAERGDRPLRVLFVGAVGLRKGTPYLLQAAERLRVVRLRLVGPVRCNADALRVACTSGVEVLGAVPRAEVARHYRWADVFCLPSVCEGSATAVYEALAAGLPVVTTPNAGSIVRDGMEGFIVPVRDPDATAGALERLAADRELLAGMSRAARRRSAFGSMEAYGKRLMAAISSLGCQM